MFKYIYNLKIQKKLVLGFGCVIFLSIVLSLITVLDMRDIDTRYTGLVNGAVKGAQISAEIGEEFADARRHLLLIAYSFDNAQAIRNAFSSFDASINNVAQLFEIQISLLENDSNVLDKDKTEGLNAMKSVRNAITVDYANIRKAVESQISEWNSNGEPVDLFVIRDLIITQGDSLADGISKSIDELVAQTKAAVEIMSNEATAYTHYVVLVVVVLSVISIILSFISSTLIGHAIRIPIENLAAAAKKIVAGDLEVQLRSNGKDETAELCNMFSDMTDTFKRLVDKINESNAKLMDGKLDVKIDEGLFIGDYKKAASAMNNLSTFFINVIFSTITCASDYVKGNFNTSVSRFTGEQAVLTEAFDALQTNLKSVNKEIQGLIASAVEGNLETRIDTENYDGDWRKITNSLNDLMGIVETPISEVSDVLEQVSAANFNVKVKGEYKGLFNAMKNSVNKTVKNTSEYITDINRILERMSKQDLNIDIRMEYLGDFKTIKDALIQIIETLNSMIGDINISSEQVAGGSEQIAQSSTAIANGATKQASYVEELNTTIESITKQTSINAKNLGVSNELVTDMRESVMENKIEMEGMLKSMLDIEEATTNISQIIKAIDDIASQTNILALNAAVEAARAGEHGKGFAVVASEVRNLAAQSQKAASETSEFIIKTVELVSGGKKAANKTSVSLNKTVEQISEINSLIEDVSKASKEEHTAILQVADGIHQIAEVTQANTSTAEEFAAAAQELSNQSDSLKTSISKFNLKR